MKAVNISVISNQRGISNIEVTINVKWYQPISNLFNILPQNL
jgi:hypothetical protein